MSTPAVFEGLIIANLLGLLLLLMAFLMFQKRQKTRLENLEAAMLSLTESQEALTQSTVGMGQKITLLTGKMKHTEQVAMASSDQASLTKAVHLVNLGATAEDIIKSCGVPRSEADLLVSMRKRNLLAKEENE